MTPTEGIAMSECNECGKCEDCETQEWLNVPMGRAIVPERCICIHALDGYETYKIDDHTIGVRPIWFDVQDTLPKKCGVYWVCYEVNGKLRSHYSIWQENSRIYKGNKFGWKSRELVRRSNIKY